MEGQTAHIPDSPTGQGGKRGTEMDKREMAKTRLVQGWRQAEEEMIIAGGWRDKDEPIRDSLRAQISGEVDMAEEDLTEEIAGTMGWTYGAITDDQMDEWRQIVVDAAIEYLKTDYPV